MALNVYDAIQSALDCAVATEDKRAAQALRVAANMMLDLHVSLMAKNDMLRRATNELEGMVENRDLWKARANGQVGYIPENLD